MRRRTRMIAMSVGGAVAVSGLLGACTSEHSTSRASTAPPATGGASSVSTGPSGSSGASSSQQPPGGTGTASSASTAAEQALQNYIAAVNSAATSGDASALSGLASSSCATCEQYLGTIKTLAAQGQKLRGGELTLSAITVDSGGSATSVNFRIKAATKAGAVVTDEGKVVSSFKATDAFTYKYGLEKRDGAWIVVSGAKIGA